MNRLYTQCAILNISQAYTAPAGCYAGSFTAPFRVKGSGSYVICLAREPVTLDPYILCYVCEWGEQGSGFGEEITAWK
jgi:hypothetical protein